MQMTKADELYAGADLHGNNVFLSVCDANGNTRFKRRVRPSLDAVNAALDPYWPRITAMGVESTFNWYRPVDGLREQGRDVKLGNPAKMKQCKGLKSTDDASDARWLAELVRLDIFPDSYIYPKDVRAVRDALRRRQLFVRRRTQVLLSLESLLERSGCYASYCRAVKSECSSSQKKKGENNRRNGNPYLAWAFIEAASFAPRFYPEIQSWYDRKKKQRNTIIAKKALAAKPSKAVWYVMNGEDFKMEMMFG